MLLSKWSRHKNFCVTRKIVCRNLFKNGKSVQRLYSINLHRKAVGILKKGIRHILHNALSMRKLCARWVLHLQKQLRKQNLSL